MKLIRKNVSGGGQAQSGECLITTDSTCWVGREKAEILGRRRKATKCLVNRNRAKKKKMERKKKSATLPEAAARFNCLEGGKDTLGP